MFGLSRSGQELPLEDLSSLAQGYHPMPLNPQNLGRKTRKAVDWLRKASAADFQEISEPQVEAEEGDSRTAGVTEQAYLYLQSVPSISTSVSISIAMYLYLYLYH